MTKIGIITTYQRILYSSAVKRDLYTSSKPFSSNPSGNEGVKKSQRETVKNEEKEKTFDIKTGEIGIPQNDIFKNLKLDEAKKLLLSTYENQKFALEDRLDSVRVMFGSKPPRNAEEEWYAKRVSFWMKRYEDFVGLTEVKAAQARVVEAEKRFINTQELRRESQANLTDIQKKIKVFIVRIYLFT